MIHKIKKMSKLHVRKGDMVMVVTGKDKGKRGKVLTAFPQKSRVIVEGVNVVTRHVKPRGQGQTGGRIEQEAAIHASNVMLFCTHCDKPTRIAHAVQSDGTKLRVCKKCNETFDS